MEREKNKNKNVFLLINLFFPSVKFIESNNIVKLKKKRDKIDEFYMERGSSRESVSSFHSTEKDSFYDFEYLM